MIKSGTSLLLIAIFCFSTLLGYQASGWLIPDQLMDTLVNQAPRQETDLSELEDQHNILVIGVDNLASPAPRLESTWLVMYFPDLAHVSFVPLYPLTASTGVESNQTLQLAFEIARDGSPSPIYLDYLASLGVWWDHYILLDRTALAELIDSSAGLKTTDGPTGMQLVSRVDAPSGDPTAVIQAQMGLIATVCRGNTQSALTASPEAILANLSGHLHTNLNTKLIHRTLHQMMKVAGSLVCEFPTITSTFSFSGGQLGYP